MDENMTMVAGDSLIFGIEIENIEDEVTSASFAAKGDLDEEELTFEKTLGDGIEYAGQSEGAAVYNISLDPEDTEDLEGQYYYQLKLGIGQEVYTVLKGILKIERSVGNVQN